jgi:hypothetical protein
MQLPKEALQEFEKIWKEENPGKEISESELIEMATHVIELVDLFYRPIPEQFLPIIEKIKKGASLYD